jgi:hypothetical protein
MVLNILCDDASGIVGEGTTHELARIRLQWATGEFHTALLLPLLAKNKFYTTCKAL